MLLVLVVLIAAVSGCAAPQVVPMDAAAMSGSERIRVETHRGPLGPQQSAAAVARLQAEDGAGLLARHLGEVERVVAAPLVLGNDAHLLIDGPRTHEAMFAAIARARAHVHLETYILESTELGERLAAMLAERQAAGVEVRVLYDSVGSRATDAVYFDRLRGAGVAVCEFNPVNPLKAGRDGWRLNNRDHRKILIVDGATAFTGGINISGVYSSGSFGSDKPPSREEGWRDTHVMMRGPVVEQFQHLFLEAWAAQGCAPEAAGEYFPRQRPRGEMAMRVVAADPQSGRSELYVALLSALANSSRRAWLTYGYFIPDRRMRDALAGAARRGVDVRLVLPGFSDFWAPFHAGRARYGELLKAGVRIFERRDALLHAKTAVIDGVWSTVGSTNLDWRSFVHNYEADVLVLDSAFAAEMEALFRLDEEASHEVLLPEWRRRPLGDRVLEWAARWWEYLL